MGAEHGGGVIGRDEHQSSAKRGLERLRDRIRGVAVGEQLAAGTAGLIGWVLGAGLIDYLFRLPGSLRLTILLVGIGLLGAAVWRRLLPTLRVKPALSTVALRLERSPFGEARGLRGVLASGIALGADRASADEPASIAVLRRQAVADADALLEGSRPWTIVDTALLRRRALWAGAVTLVAAGIAIASPSTAWTGLARQVAPLGSAAWPSRFEIADVTATEVHPIGTALPVRALVTRTNRDLGDTPVTVVHRVVSSDGVSSWRREPATPQRTVEFVQDGSAQGEAYERLLETPDVASSDDAPARLEYYFQTPDDRTATAVVQLVEQPEITGFVVDVRPPAYAANANAAFVSGVQEIDRSAGARRLVGPVIAGSAVTVTATLNKPALPTSDAVVTDIESGDAPAGVQTTPAGDTVVIEWTADSSARVSLGVRDQFGLESLDDAVLRFDVVPDSPPTSSIVLPARDESVLATAVVEIESEGRDDVALAWVGIESERARVPSDSEGAEPEPDGSATELVRVDTSETRHVARASIDLATQGLVPGDVLIVTGLAADTFDRDGATHGVVRSEPRRLRIISESELLDEVLAEFGGVRRAAIRLDEQQFEIGESVRDALERGDRPEQDAARRQSAVSESLSAVRESLERVADRVERNGLRDDGLDRVLREAAAASERGERAAEQASEALRDATERESDPNEARESAEQAQDASDDVRRALEELARTLDRGEDAWSMRRALEGIVQDQQDVSGATASASASTVGRSAEELTEQERSLLDEIAQRQLELAERAAELLDELEERAEQSADGDPGQSAAMRAASRRGREQGVAQQLRDAARAVAENRGAEAGRAQAEAQEQLEEMLRDLEDAERQRDAELQRALLSLVETIESLIRAQESELARLDAGEVALAGGMERLHRNTLSALDEASGDTSLVAVATPLREASDAQTAAIVLLRDAADPVEIRAAEERSLAALERALEAAQAALDDAQQREQDRKREEVQEAYRVALEEQVRITMETAGYAERRLSRRERAALRDLAERERLLRDDIEAVRTLFPEVTESSVFDFAHTRLSDTLGRVEESLNGGEAGGLTPLDQATVERVLRGLIAALDPPEQGEEQDFDQGGGGNAGGAQQGGPQPLIPPIAQLQMLRTLQQDVYDRTRAVEDAGLGADAAAQIGGEQREVAAQARALLEAMQQQQPPAGAPAPENNE